MKSMCQNIVFVHDCIRSPCDSEEMHPVQMYYIFDNAHAIYFQFSLQVILKTGDTSVNVLYLAYTIFGGFGIFNIWREFD